MMEGRRRAGGRGIWRFCFPLLGWSVATSAAAGDGGAAKAAQAVWAELVPGRYRERAAFDWVPPRDGKAKLEEAIAFFRNRCPGARLVFVTTAPVPENSRGRVAGDAERYNTAASAVLSDHPDILICDLFAFTKPMQTRWWTEPGNVHYTEEGCRAQGGEVARIVRRALAEGG